MGNESILVSVFPLAFTVVDHFTTLPLPTMGLFYSTYKEKRKNRCLEDAIACVRQCYENTGKYPTIEQMGDGFAWLYLPRTKDVISKYLRFFDLLGDNSEAVKKIS